MTVQKTVSIMYNCKHNDVLPIHACMYFCLCVHIVGHLSQPIVSLSNSCTSLPAMSHNCVCVCVCVE